MWTSKLRRSLLLVACATTLLRAGCCTISCDPSLIQAYAYQDAQTQTAFTAFLKNLGKFKKAFDENVKAINDYNKVLAAVLAREEYEYALEKKRYYYIDKMYESYSNKFDIEQIRSEVDK